MGRGDSGSALVEAVVATAIVAGVLGAAFEATSEARARAVALDQRRMALMIARSEMAAVGSTIPVTAGETSGADGDFTWRVRIEPAEASQSSPAGAPALVTVSVRLARSGPDLVQLKTLRLAATS